MKATILTTCVLLFLVGCDERAANNPYPGDPPASNTLYSAFTLRPKHLDPAKSYSEDEWVFIAQIYEPPLQYNYLDRPYKLEPLTAEQFPEPHYDAATNTSTYTIKIKQGIYYQVHPAFAKNANGNYVYHDLNKEQVAKYSAIADFKQVDSRELVAADYVNEIKRLADPKINSPIYGLMKDYIVGFAEFRKTLQEIYDHYPQITQVDLRLHDLVGAKVIDKYTYSITITGKYPQFKYWLAMTFFAPVPWEADRFYNQDGMADHNISLDWYPIGTGAFYLTENNPDRRMVLERNKQFHAEYFPGKPELRLPFLDKVVFSLERENIPAWDKFLQGYYDASGISSDNFNYAISNSSSLELSKPLRDRGIRLKVYNSLTVTYWAFNMLDEVVGGYTARARKLRKAISMALDVDEYITIFYNGRAIPAAGPIPVGLLGGKEATKDDYNPKRARELLTEAGYPGGINPKTGEALQIFFEAAVSGDPNQQAVLKWLRKQFRKVGIDLIIRATDYNRFREKIMTGNAQMFLWGWHADYPDPENFLFLLYGPNSMSKYGGENTTNYNNPDFNSLYEKFEKMGDDPRREELIDKMLQILNRDMPWIWGFFPQEYTLYNPWYGFVDRSKMINNYLKYISLDPKLRADLRRTWNSPSVWPLGLLILGIVIVFLPAIIGYIRNERATARRTP